MSRLPLIGVTACTQQIGPHAYHISGDKYVRAVTVAAKGLPLEPGEPTKRMPKGFEDQAGGPLEAAVKRTRWLVRRPLSGVEIGGPDLPSIIAGFAADAQPLLDFGWKALRP